MKNSSKFFSNKDCEYFPCHKGPEEDSFNCLFCYCPLNRFDDCPGEPEFIKLKNGKIIKDCSSCTFPHRAENYDKVLKFLKNKMY